MNKGIVGLSPLATIRAAMSRGTVIDGYTVALGSLRGTTTWSSTSATRTRDGYYPVSYRIPAISDCDSSVWLTRHEVLSIDAIRAAISSDIKNYVAKYSR